MGEVLKSLQGMIRPWIWCSCRDVSAMAQRDRMHECISTCRRYEGLNMYERYGSV